MRQNENKTRTRRNETRGEWDKKRQQTMSGREGKREENKLAKYIAHL
jgi:hypothetical protein